MSTVKRLRAETSVVVVIDIQDKLLAKIPSAPALLRNTGFVLDVAALLEVPARATEQYPKGLGPTAPEIALRLPANLPAKTAFSCCGAGTFLEELEMLRRPDVVLVGMETHVCVAQTALDLLRAGLHVFLPVDALGARYDLDHSTALRRLEQAGAVPTTVAAVAFEWLTDATHPQFKAVSELVKRRVEG
ncbi:isochorismatase hydrolase : Isochorismatase hydrolase OS=Methylomonas methanica (strain MC09) GN=Metme_0601 PE=4 SV=1: Isochorismatase [Gemmata massiliana]|uniref:Isochorismatase-like domain-containing protein n=1 Tax=Gemmata massiliana TaxID=1210884 RepID=A0A6P2D096_9BACT|nr:isochorismatase family protein [Gemmata massiliana]VTR93484.1 isochorismatase hydrolase : Isochorismatase hydrolase OS=Methylomonas methanica (strain MC09) GN=Metme_0601 PE=4 SV=1: Isochorismatase [Gemmata massiliana]